jgi:hypothetical protein
MERGLGVPARRWTFTRSLIAATAVLLLAFVLSGALVTTEAWSEPAALNAATHARVLP